MAGAIDKLEAVNAKLDDMPERIRAILELGGKVNTPPAAIPGAGVQRRERAALDSKPGLTAAAKAPVDAAGKQESNIPTAAVPRSAAFASPPSLPSPRSAGGPSSGSAGGLWLNNVRGQRDGQPIQMGGKGGSSESNQAMTGLLKEILGELRRGKSSGGGTGASPISGPVQASRPGIRVGIRN